MKRLILIVSLILISFLAYTGNDVVILPNISAPKSSVEMLIDVLKPIAPIEATFEDDTTININNLKPIVPFEATFED